MRRYIAAAASLLLTVVTMAAIPGVARAADPQGARIVLNNFCSQVPRIGDYCVNTRTVVNYLTTPSGKTLQHEVTSGTSTLLGTGIFPPQVTEARNVLFIRTDNSEPELMFTFTRGTVTYTAETCEVFEHYRYVDGELVCERVTRECQPIP